MYSKVIDFIVVWLFEYYLPNTHTHTLSHITIRWHAVSIQNKFSFQIQTIRNIDTLTFVLASSCSTCEFIDKSFRFYFCSAFLLADAHTHTCSMHDKVFNTLLWEHEHTVKVIQTDLNFAFVSEFIWDILFQKMQVCTVYRDNKIPILLNIWREPFGIPEGYCENLSFNQSSKGNGLLRILLCIEQCSKINQNTNFCQRVLENCK